MYQLLWMNVMLELICMDFADLWGSGRDFKFKMKIYVRLYLARFEPAVIRTALKSSYPSALDRSGHPTEADNIYSVKILSDLLAQEEAHAVKQQQ